MAGTCSYALDCSSSPSYHASDSDASESGDECTEPRPLRSARLPSSSGEGPSTRFQPPSDNEETRIFRKTCQDAARLIPCHWQKCRAKLGSFTALAKHVKTSHFLCIESDPSVANSKGLRKYPCRWTNCSNRTYPTVEEMARHVWDFHLNTIRLGCPVQGCVKILQDDLSLRWHIAEQHHLDVRLRPTNGSSTKVSSSTPVPLSSKPSRLPAKIPSLIPSSQLYASLVLPATTATASASNAFERLRLQHTPTFTAAEELYHDDDPMENEVLLHRSLKKKRRDPTRLTRQSSWLQPLSRTNTLITDLSTPSSSQATTSGESAFTDVRVSERLRGLTLYIPPRPSKPPAPDVPILNWGGSRIRDLRAGSDAASSTRAPSVRTSLQGSSSRESSVSTPPPGVASRPMIVSSDPPQASPTHISAPPPLSKTSSDATSTPPAPVAPLPSVSQLLPILPVSSASSGPYLDPPHSSIGFQALRDYWDCKKKADKAGVDARVDPPTFLKTAAARRAMKKSAGRPPKRPKLD